MVSDVVAFLLWPFIAQAFPEAKFIHFEREIDSWFTSFNYQLYRQMNVGHKLPSWLAQGLGFLLSPTTKEMNNFSKFILINVTGHGHWNPRTTIPWSLNFDIDTMSKLFCHSVYKKHNANVIANIPKDKLLLLDEIVLGWEKLCRFTGDQVPMKDGKILDWPHKNINSELTDEFFHPKSLVMSTVKSEIMHRMLIFLAIIALAVIMFKLL